MVDGVVRIDTGEQVLEYQQGELVSMISGGLKESDYWSYEATLGFTTRTGNTDQTDLSAYAKIQRETALTRGFVSYRGSYGKASGDTTANNHRGQLQFDSYVTRRLFIVLPAAEVFRDTFQNIALRTTAGAGIGYDLITWPKLSWEVGTGVNFQYTDFDSSPVGEAGTSNDAAVALNTTIELDPVSNVEWDTTYKVQIVVTDLDLTNHNLTSVVSLDIWGPLDLDVTVVWDRIEKPRLDANGVRPKSNDLRTTVGLSLDF
jgi:putative salt-induced outer membrane protein YdiY